MLTIRKRCILLDRRESLKRKVAQSKAFQRAQDFSTFAKLKEKKRNYKRLYKKNASSHEKFYQSTKGSIQILSEKIPQL